MAPRPIRPTEDHTVAQGHVAGKLRAVGEGAVVADDAIMTDMAVSHEIAAGPDLGEIVPLLAAEAERHALPDHAIFADAEAGSSPIIAPDLGFAAEHGMGMDHATGTDLGPAGDRHMGEKTDAISEMNLATDDAVRADFNPSSEDCSVLNDCRRMHRHCRPCLPGSSRKIRIPHIACRQHRLRPQTARQGRGGEGL